MSRSDDGLITPLRSMISYLVRLLPNSCPAQVIVMILCCREIVLGERHFDAAELVSSTVV